MGTYVISDPCERVYEFRQGRNRLAVGTTFIVVVTFGFTLLPFFRGMISTEVAEFLRDALSAAALFGVWMAETGIKRLRRCAPESRQRAWKLIAIAAVICVVALSIAVGSTLRSTSRQKQQFQLLSERLRPIFERQKVRSKAADAIYFSRPKSLDDYVQQCETLKTLYAGWEGDLSEADSLLSQYDLGTDATQALRSTFDQARKGLALVEPEVTMAEELSAAPPKQKRRIMETEVLPLYASITAHNVDVRMMERKSMLEVLTERLPK